MLRWTSVYKCLYCILSYFLLGRCLGAVSLDHMAALSLVFWGISILLSILVCTNLLIKVPVSPHLCQHLLLLLPLILAILTGMRWNLSIILICISFITGILNTSSCIYWPFVSLPLRILCLIHVPISYWGSTPICIPFPFIISPKPVCSHSCDEMHSLEPIRLGRR
jgi:hypothetical protein